MAMKYFIVHGNPKRREKLEKHLRERGIYDFFDVHWITEFPCDDPFVEWIHETVAKNVSKRTLSGFVKSCEILRSCEDEYFMASDDDVVFIEDWKKHFEETEFGLFTCMALGVNFHLLPEGKRVFSGNIGGCECTVWSKKFAQFYLNNLDFSQAADIVVSGMMGWHGMKLEIVPICQQTSFLEKGSSSIEHDVTKYDVDWITYVTNYRPSGNSYYELIKAYEAFKNMKHVVEEDFKKRFGIEIDIYNTRYVYERFKALTSK